jgi:hypothetical protein
MENIYQQDLGLYGSTPEWQTNKREALQLKSQSGKFEAQNVFVMLVYAERTTTTTTTTTRYRQ